MPSLPLLADLADLVVPRECGGCGTAGDRCCPTCRAVLAGARPRAWSPDPRPRGFPPAWACLPYEGVVRQVVVAWKDRGRRDLARVLAPVLTLGLAAAAHHHLCRPGAAPHPVPESPAPLPLLLVPAPSSAAATRSRGDRPLLALCRLAARALPPDLVSVTPALRQGRTVADQAGLGRAERAENLAGSMVVGARAAALVAGAHCVVVDDVVTTGATLTEAARVLDAAGAASVSAVTVAATRRTVGGAGAPGRAHGGARAGR